MLARGKLKMNYEEFVSMLMQNYNEQNPNRAKILLEWLVDSVDQSQLKMIFKEIIENEGFFPGPDKIKKYMGRLSGNNADESYSVAIKSASKVGSYKSVQFTNELISETIQRGWGGWPEFCLDEQEREWRRKTFVDIYNSLSSNINYDSHLQGIFERQNGRFQIEKIGGSHGRLGSKASAGRYLEQQRQE